MPEDIKFCDKENGLYLAVGTQEGLCIVYNIPDHILLYYELKTQV